MSTECEDANSKLQYAINTRVSVIRGGAGYPTWEQKIEAIKQAVHDGANVDNYDYATQNTPLCYAIRNGYSDLITFFIDKGADLDCISPNGDTPLTLCIQMRSQNAANLLIKYGANVCRPNGNNKTPLSMAVLKDDMKMAILLLHNGANFNIQTAFLEAIQSRSLGFVEFFIATGASVNFRYKDGYTPLIAAVEKRSVLIVEKLFEHGADVNILDKKGVSPLIKSMEVRSVELLKKLLDRGADMNIPDASGTYPLVKSIEMSRFEMLKVTVEGSKNAVDFAVINHCGHTALTKAIAKHNFEPIKYLVDRGADVNQIDNNQKTPLVTAAENSNVRCFEFLIKSGADVESCWLQIEEVARNNDDFSVHVQGLRKQLEKKRLERDIIDLVGDAGHEEA